ncbi:hypothetical protein IAG44_33870 [Streptomyces roseirectus]|uniref:Tetratricopeptide repeat protein n=1 Tax=Streptomyces roseirectus TaxID=2768066 RepID=A0A7H0ITC4_9ACTN|nr:hypothetical protein [Streptomyces roseirectus]QNP76040.1 hypothetical protein IAG44_33870 [Streptomyces roseirectus]
MVERREQAVSDALSTRIGQVVMLHRGGDREEARDRLLALWAEVGEDGAVVHRCTLAHYLADTQDDPSDELAWDLRALTAAEESPGDVRSLYPSLHLNLAADYEKLGRPDAARTHLRAARVAARGLGEDGYSAGVREAIERLAVRLGEGEGESWGPWGPWGS